MRWEEKVGFVFGSKQLFQGSANSASCCSVLPVLPFFLTSSTTDDDQTTTVNAGHGQKDGRKKTQRKESLLRRL
ncbi:hypothetical protein TWF481_003764 [Arthrobotrys musiformis]|uniref:Uncharacterized protein n=1 Tax=Arthrobotrys musiformis TaxID=47236 RepID=A0AAV9WHL3_9PEZI